MAERSAQWLCHAGGQREGQDPGEHFFDQVNAIAVPSYECGLGLGRRIEHARVPNTNHIFTTGTGKEAVAQAIADWVARHFT